MQLLEASVAELHTTRTLLALSVWDILDKFLKPCGIPPASAQHRCWVRPSFHVERMVGGLRDDLSADDPERSLSHTVYAEFVCSNMVDGRGAALHH